MYNQPVVIDNGSGCIKAGFAGVDIPKCIFGNLVGRPKHLRVMAGGLELDHYIGRAAEEHRGMLSKNSLETFLGCFNYKKCRSSDFSLPSQSRHQISDGTRNR